MKILWLTNLPAPYKVDLFNELGKKVELTVLFERMGATNRDNTWNKNTFENFNGVFLKGIKIDEENSICLSVKKYLADKTFDKIVIGGYGTFTSMYAIKYLRKKNIPYILSIDGGVIREESVKKYKLKRYLVMGASKYMCPSKKSADYLFHYGANRNNIYFYPFTSVKESDVYMANEQEKQQLKKALLIPEQKIILAVGQFIKRKGFDLLIKASSDLGEDYGVYIIGGKPTEEYVNLRKEYNANNVHFLPFKNKTQLANYFKMADLFVLPTREDIWGLVINEAMAYSLGVITTNNCVAGLELVKHGENGYIIPTENVEEITNSILQAEKVGFSKLGDKSLELILENGTIEKEAQVILEILS